MNNAQDKKRGLWRPLLLLAMVITVFILAKVFNLGDKLGLLRDWIASLGPWGPVAFALLYIIAVVAALPGSAITIAAGALFGSLAGVILVSISSTLGAGLAFLISRYFARKAVSSWLANKEKFQKLDKLTEEHGSIIVAITRLVPLFPFNLLNYGFGLTRVKFSTYFFWSWLCMLPGTILYVVGADAVTSGLAEGKVPWVLVIIVLLAIVILTLLVRQAKKALQSKEQKVEKV